MVSKYKEELSRRLSEIAKFKRQKRRDEKKWFEDRGMDYHTWLEDHVHEIAKAWTKTQWKVICTLERRDHLPNAITSFDKNLAKEAGVSLRTFRDVKTVLKQEKALVTLPWIKNQKKTMILMRPNVIEATIRRSRGRENRVRHECHADK